MFAVPFRACWWSVALLVSPLGLSGCATPPATPPNPHAATRQHILSAAERMVGTPYVLGGESPGGVDCSGLVQYAYRQAGIRVPRTTVEQFQAGRLQRRVQPGDLVFFRTDGSGRVSHVGIYAGKGQMIHASSGSGRVRKVSLGQPYWRKRMAGGATFLGAGMPPVTRRWPADNGPNG